MGSKDGPLALIGTDEVLLAQLANVARATICASAVVTTHRWDPATDGADAPLGPEGNALRDTAKHIAYVRRSGEHRNAWACQASTHEFEALPGPDELLAEDFQAFVLVLRLPPAPCLGPGTTFVCTTFPDAASFIPDAAGAGGVPPDWVVGHDAVEVRADLFTRQDKASVISQLARVRRVCRSMPIIYTVRSASQGGAFPDDEHEAWELLRVGLCAGVEYVDVEACWTREGRNAFAAAAKGGNVGVRLISSFHDIQRPISEVADGELQSLLHECASTNAVDIVKVVGRANSVQCSIRVNQAALAVQPWLPEGIKSVVAICTTDAGRLSRVLNGELGPTPVTHPSLPGCAAPGQLTAAEIDQIRAMLQLPLLQAVATGGFSSE